MLHKKSKNETDDATRASVLKEMSKPRLSRSARIAEQNLDTTRSPEQPSITMPGVVEKIIPSSGSERPERVQIAVHDADRLRIQNTLIDENGDDVKLTKGGHVEVTVKAEPVA